MKLCHSQLSLTINIGCNKNRISIDERTSKRVSIIINEASSFVRICEANRLSIIEIAVKEIKCI